MATGFTRKMGILALAAAASILVAGPGGAAYAAPAAADAPYSTIDADAVVLPDDADVPDVSALPADPAWVRMAGRIVTTARAQLGYREHGDNCTKYGPCEEWCSLFATWVWRTSGSDIPKYPFTGSVYRWGQRNPLSYDKNHLSRARYGDVLLFGTGPADTTTSTHIGVVESVSGDGKYVTLIEGNHSDKVARVKHRLSSSIFYGGVMPMARG